MARNGGGAQNNMLATQIDIAQYVAKQLATQEGLDEVQSAGNVMMLFTAIGKFVAFMFRKTHFETVIADVFGFGNFIRNCTIGKIGVTQFYPTSTIAAELKIFKQFPTQFKEPMQRQELTLSRLAQVCSMSEDKTHKVMQMIGKAIGHYLRQERKQVTLDLKLPSNEILHFTADSITMTERNLIVGLLDSAIGGTNSGNHSPFVKRSSRYDLREIMGSSHGAGILNSPAFQANKNRLNADTLMRIPGDGGATSDPEQRSIRSKRSLSINVSKVSKIIKMNDDGSSCISRARGDQRFALRHRSTDKAFSRGHNGAGGSASVRPHIKDGLYQNNVHPNSHEDIKSTVSKHSNIVHDMLQKNYQTLTPNKLSMPATLHTDIKSNSVSRNPLRAQTLDQAMAEDAQSVESYKRRSVNYHRNPLLPPKELLVGVPQHQKTAATRTPYYQTQRDLIIDGVGEANRGVPRPSDKQTLLGHHDQDLKQQILGHFTKDNINSVYQRLGQQTYERLNEIEAYNAESRRVMEDQYRMQLLKDNRKNEIKMTLKERLIAQKQERLNQDLVAKIEEKRFGPTSVVFEDQIRPVPNHRGHFEKVFVPASTTDAFKKLGNPEIETMKSASYMAKNLGPGVSQLCLDTFRLLKNEPSKLEQQNNKQNLVKESLNLQVQSLMKQREEFHTQIRQFNEQKEREKLKKKEMQRQNGEYWKMQIQQKNEQNEQERHSAFVKDPHQLWTIEAPNRVLTEQEKTKKSNQEVKNELDCQVMQNAQGRKQNRQNDLSLGRQMIEADLEKTTRENQMEAYKRHEMSKQLRDAWTTQQMIRESAKNVETLF